MDIKLDRYAKSFGDRYKNLTKKQIKDIVDMLQSITRRAVEIYIKTKLGKENYGTI